MLATAPSDIFQPFIHKLGYSVGLENLLDRFLDFSRTYGESQVFTYADLMRLVHSTWNLKTNHVLDVLRSLEVVVAKNGEVAVLEAGESLGLLWQFQDSLDLRRSVEFTLVHALLLADGDIFLNALAAGFDPVDFVENLRRSMEYKWQALEVKFQTPSHRAQIYKTINIDVQSNNRGSKGRIQGLGPLLATDDHMRRGPLGLPPERPSVNPSADFVKKVMATRKAWALSFGFFSDGLITPKGRTFLQALHQGGLGGPACYSVCPLRHQLDRPAYSAFQKEDLLSSWDLFLLVSSSLGAGREPVAWNTDTHEQGIKLLEAAFAAFWRLNQSKRMIRHQMFSGTIYRLVIALGFNGEGPLPLPEIIAREQDTPSPRVLARKSRLGEFTLSLR